MAPFKILAAGVGLDGALDLPQHLPAHVADRRTQRKDGIRGGEVADSVEIRLVKPACGLAAAAFQQRIGDADGGGGLELHLHSGFIILHQQRTVQDGTDVLPVVVPVAVHQPAGKAGQQLGEGAFGQVILPGKHLGHSGEQRLGHLPQLRLTGVAPHPGVRYIKDVAQPGETAAFVQQGDALGPRRT